MTLDSFLQSYAYILKGSIKNFENQFRKTILVWIPQPLRSLCLKKYFFFSPSGLGKHILIFGFWDPLLSFLPISYTSLLPIKPNQLPSLAVVLQKRMKMRKRWWGHSSLPCRILEIAKRQQSVACVSVSEYVGDGHLLMMQRNGLISRLWWWKLCNEVFWFVCLFVFLLINLPKMGMGTRTLKSTFVSQLLIVIVFNLPRKLCIFFCNKSSPYLFP